MTFSTITELVRDELIAVNALIIDSLSSHVDEVEQIGHYLIEAGGKRIRPVVTLLSAKACGAIGDSVISMATIIEFIHSATLLHDDVVDGSTLRRGRPTANHVWDNPSAVLVGDFLYSRAFQMMVGINNMPAMRILADATNAIAEGEVMQLTHRFAPDVTEARYFNVIRLKTAKLFEAAAELGGVLAEQPVSIQKALAQYGLHLGAAFQLVDDVLDYQAEGAWGKNLGDDLAEGKVTLPLIYALQHADTQEAVYLREAIQSGAIEDLPRIQEAIVSSGAIDYTMRAAMQETQLAIDAIDVLPSSRYKEAMIELAKFAVNRGQ
jgi:octaprenyl-diphosphate synthase